jgi:mannan endo-1,4-beta-mannosidase
MDDDVTAYAGISNTYPASGFEGASYHGLVQIPELDMASYHFYPTDWGLTNPTTDGTIWVNAHQSIARAAGKVAYWGEFGYPKNATDAQRAPIYDAWLEAFFSATADGSAALFWQLIPASRSGGDDGYGVYAAKDTATVAAFEKYSAPRALR